MKMKWYRMFFIHTSTLLCRKILLWLSLHVFSPQLTFSSPKWQFLKQILVLVHPNIYVMVYWSWMIEIRMKNHLGRDSNCNIYIAQIFSQGMTNNVMVTFSVGDTMWSWAREYFGDIDFNIIQWSRAMQIRIPLWQKRCSGPLKRQQRRFPTKFLLSDGHRQKHSPNVSCW